MRSAVAVLSAIMAMPAFWGTRDGQLLRALERRRQLIMTVPTMSNAEQGV